MKVINKCGFAIIAMLCALGAECAAAVKIRALVFSRVGDVREVLVAGADGKLVDKKPLGLHTLQLSERKEVPSRALVFLEAPASGVDDDPEALENLKKIAKVVLPEGGAEYVLVFMPNKNGADYPYVVHALPLSERDFGSGDQAFVNFCKTELGFNFDKKLIVVRPGKVGVYSPKKIDGKHTIVGYEKQKDGKWSQNPFYSSRMIVQKGVRNLVFIVPNSRTGRPEFRGITDFVK